MVRCIFGMAELVASVSSIMGLSLVSQSPRSFLIEQFIIVFPHILTYASSIIQFNKHVTKSEASKIVAFIIGVINATVLFIALVGLFISIGQNIGFYGGKLVCTMYIEFPHNIPIPFLPIIASDSISMCVIDAYDISIANTHN